MKKVIAFFVLLSLLLSCCGCADKREAEAFSNRIESLCNKSSPEYNTEDIIELYSSYQALDPEIQERIENSDTLKNETAAIITSKITAAKNGDLEQVEEWLSEYKDLLTTKQMEDCLEQYGRWGALEQAENKIKSFLKSPRSYYRYEGSITEPIKEDDGYKVTVKLYYGASNSFGAEVTNNATVYVWYTIDTNKATATYTKVELSAYDEWRALNP